MISAKVPCFIHPEEATLPLRWLCQLPLCGLAAEERLKAIIPRQQVNTSHPTVLKSIGLFCTIKRRFNRRCQYHIWKSASSSGARAALPLPELPTKPEKNCCQADGDAVDFVSRLFGLPSKAAAMKLADDFGISYDNRQKHRIKPHIREPTPEQRYCQEESGCYKVLSDYFHHLRTWKQQYAPKQPEDEWHPLFVEALQRESHIEYQK